MRSPSHLSVAFTALSAAHFLTPATASAQVAPGIHTAESASTGSTEVATSGFEARVEPAPDAKDATEASLSAGGLAASGNSRSLAVTGGGRFRLRRRAEQLSFATAGNYARAAAESGAAMTTTVENLQGKLRYDHFLGHGLALFAAVSARRDRFQGLDLRLNFDPGVAYYFVDRDTARLWTELGYDFQYDVRRDETLDLARADGSEFAKAQERHSGRAFLGHEAKLSDQVQVSSGVEYLQGIPDTEYWRLNLDGEVSSALGSGFSIATSVAVKYDHHPLPDVVGTDVQTAISLVYQLR